MFEKLVEKMKGERLGSAFAVLLSVFVGIGAIAVTGQRDQLDTVFVTSEIDIESPINANGDGLMLGGYDPVAYFLDGRARQGLTSWTARWGAAAFRFASEENRDAFLADPTRFMPQFGGFDAEGVRQGELRKADPTAYIIVDDRLYLLQDARILANWSLDGLLNAAVADRIWPRLLDLMSGELRYGDRSAS